MRRNIFKDNTGSEFWEKAKKIIPGGNQILSKRPERFLPKFWPTYYKKAKGCVIWDLDGNQYYDFASMGVGSCVLGYADKDIDSAVIKSIRNGSMCSLNANEEIQLSEKLIDLHPWAEMCEVLKIRRRGLCNSYQNCKSFYKKSKIVFCGYHGWQDWYIASNLSNKKNLDNQLLSGLDASGVPEN